MIQVRNLRKEYPGVTPLVDVNADFEKGEVVSIIGPSGVGKSTFLRCLNRLEAPTSGHILVDGVDIAGEGVDLPKVRQKIGMVFESGNLFGHRSVLENVMMAPVDVYGLSKEEARRRAHELLYKTGLAERVDCYPDELSGGQRQRLAIARALAMRPEVLLFDEPTGTLEPTMVPEVLDVIRDLAEEGLTMVIVTRETRFARDVSNRVLYLDEGEVYEQGTPEQLFDNPQRERTRNFVFHVRSWSCEVHNARFDFYRMSSSLNDFCMRQFIPHRLANAASVVFEEVMMNRLRPAIEKARDPEIRVTLSSGEEGKDLRLAFSYQGLSEDPLLLDDMDDVPGKLITRYSNKVRGTSTMTAEYEII